MLLAAAGAGAAALLGSEAGGVSNYVGAMRTVSGNGGSRGGSKKHDDTLLSASKVASVEAGLLPIAFPGGGANGNGIHAHRNSQQLPGLEQRRAPAPASASTQQQQQQPTHPCCPHAPARDSSTIGARHLVRHSSGGQLGGARAALLVLGLRGRTALLGCCAAALTCCARGAQLAAALLRSGGDKGALMVPMALQGALGKGQRLVCACAWGGEPPAPSGTLLFVWVEHDRAAHSQPARSVETPWRLYTPQVPSWARQRAAHLSLLPAATPFGASARWQHSCAPWGP